MEKVDLPPMTMQGFSFGEKDITFFNSFSEFFLYLEKMKVEGKGLSFTYLSLDLYTRWWEVLVGAKVGRKIKGQVCWR